MQKTWLLLLKYIAATVAMSCLFLGTWKFIEYMGPPPQRNKVFDTSGIFTLLFTILVTLIAAVLFGWNLAKRAGQGSVRAFGYGMVWGALMQIIIALASTFSVWKSYYSAKRSYPELKDKIHFHLSSDWPQKFIIDMLVCSMAVGALVLIGYALKTWKRMLSVVCVVLVVLTAILFYNYYTILF